MHKILLVLAGISFILVLSGGGCLEKKEDAGSGEGSDKDRAIAAAREIFTQKKKEGLNMESGPCISEKLELDPPLLEWWVIDVAHQPRIAADNKPENQCQAWGAGDAKHFVELNLDGDLIKAN